MKKTIALLTAFLSLLGCSNDNKLSIQNLAQGTIYLNFRASIDSVYPGATHSITEIPNGTYEYSTTFELPPGVISFTTSGGAAGGQLTFDKKSTKVLLLYSSTTLTGAYTLYVNKTSSQPVSSTSPTSAQ